MSAADTRKRKRETPGSRGAPAAKRGTGARQAIAAVANEGADGLNESILASIGSRFVPMTLGEPEGRFTSPVTAFDTLATIALADSRHDFKSFSQDTPSQKRGFPEIDYFKGFSANIQRIVLGLDKTYSQKFTASMRQCGRGTLGNDPEDDFRQLTERLYVRTSTTITAADTGKVVAKYKIPAPSGDNYAPYHKAIYDQIRKAAGIYEGATKWDEPLPVIIDTSGTLGDASTRSFFEICRPKECVADPSNTSKRDFPMLITEAGELSRKYKINNVEYTVKGAYNQPEIDFKIGEQTYSYNFGGGPRKPNEIEMCKSKISDVIGEIVKFKGFPVANGPTADKINDYCIDYGKITYPKVEPGPLEEIALPYIAKRAGDHLQVLACKQRINYDITGSSPQSRINCIFWTQDIMAACFAIMNQVTTVFQHLSTKEVTIYAVDRYTPVRGGLFGVGGDPCTRRALRMDRRRITPSVDDVCYNNSMAELINPHNNQYSPYVALDFLYYYALKNMGVGDASSRSTLSHIFNKLNEHYSTPSAERESDLKLTLDQIFYFGAEIPTQPAAGGAGVENPPLVVFQTPTVTVKVPFRSVNYEFSLATGVMDSINIFDIVGGARLAIREIEEGPVTEDAAAAAADTDEGMARGRVNDATADNDEVMARGERTSGGATQLHKVWAREQSETRTDDTLFLNFLQLLTDCEDEYFRHQDYTDSIYIYDPTADIRIGGHVQTQMMCFFTALIHTYILALKQGRLSIFLTMFKFFPNMLKESGNTLILSDIEIFTQCWHEDFVLPYVSALPPQVQPIHRSMFDTILKQTKAKDAQIRANVTMNDGATARYLHRVFPHGSFHVYLSQLDTPESRNALNTALNVANISAAAPSVATVPGPNTSALRNLSNVTPLAGTPVYVSSNGSTSSSNSSGSFNPYYSGPYGKRGGRRRTSKKRKGLHRTRKLRMNRRKTTRKSPHPRKARFRVSRGK